MPELECARDQVTGDGGRRKLQRNVSVTRDGQADGQRFAFGTG